MEYSNLQQSPSTPIPILTVNPLVTKDMVWVQHLLTRKCWAIWKLLKCNVSFRAGVRNIFLAESQNRLRQFGKPGPLMISSNVITWAWREVTWLGTIRMTPQVVAVPCPPSQIGPEVSAVIVTIVINIIPASQHRMDQAGFKRLVCILFM